MSTERPIQASDEVVIDANHIALIASLVTCQKPKKVLEIGIGSGATTRAILNAIHYNQNEASLTCVDNFLDWGGEPPKGLESLQATIVVMSEREFVSTCQSKYDFIVSDADHEHSHEWVAKTMGLLNDGGIAVFHDVSNPDYTNLSSIVSFMQWAQLTHVVFDKSSRPDERCHRGLLVVFK